MTQSLINTKLLPFNATAFSKGDFVELSEQDLLGKVVSSIFLPCRLYFCMSYRIR